MNLSSTVARRRRPRHRFELSELGRLCDVLIEFKLLESGVEPRDLPGTHPGVYSEAIKRGILSEYIGENIQDLWRNHRAKTYYQDGLAAKLRAETMFELAVETHAFVVNLSAKKHECICE